MAGLERDGMLLYFIHELFVFLHNQYLKPVEKIYMSAHADDQTQLLQEVLS
jgi:hypothetical protein